MNDSKYSIKSETERQRKISSVQNPSTLETIPNWNKYDIFLFKQTPNAGGRTRDEQFDLEAFSRRIFNRHQFAISSPDGTLKIPKMFSPSISARRSPDTAPTSTEEARIRKLFALIALVYGLFIVYGSLIPFDFERRSLDQILAALLLGNKNSTLVSLSDRATNILLSIPLAFFTLGAISRRDDGQRNVVASVGTFLGCIALAIAVETLQAFTPARVASVGDILAQAFGSLIGILLWFWLSTRVLSIVQSLVQSNVARIDTDILSTDSVRILAVVYLITLVALNGWITANWRPLNDAWNSAKIINYLPFYYQYSANIFVSIVSVTKILLIYAPLGAYFGIFSASSASANISQRNRNAALTAGAVALVLESGKLFIRSKHPDFTNVLLAAGSSAASCWLFPRCLSVFRVLRASREKLPETTTLQANTTVQTTSVRFVTLRIAAILTFAATALGILFFPLGRAWLGLAIAIYSLAVIRYPAIWLFVIPALLPSFDLTPWTGWFFVNEFDFFILATVASGFWLSASRSPSGFRQLAAIRLLLIAFAGSTLLSLFIGLLPLQNLDFNAFGNYYSHYNALRAAKGLLEVFALLPLLIYCVGAGYDSMRYLNAGMVVGLATAVAASIWERMLFPGLFDFTSNYRISAMFSSMHTGDSSIEAYLIAAIPFIATWAFYRKSILTKAAGALLLALSTYSVFVTFSRGGYAAYVLIVVILTAGSWLASKASTTTSYRPVVTVLVASALLVSAMAAMILESSFAKARLSTTESDFGVRLRHWRGVIAMMDADWSTTLFGMGLGRYPDIYFKRNWSVPMPSTISYLTEGNNTFLRMGPGAPAYLEQIVPVLPDQLLKLSLDLRPTSSAATLNAMICQRTFFRSFNCKDARFSSAAGETLWTSREASINTGDLGSGQWFTRRIVKLVLENVSNDAAIDIDNVKIDDGRGNNLVKNGNFSQGPTYWFFSSFDHLNWHIKNILVQLLFEQGWLGLITFALLTLVSILYLWSVSNRGAIAFLVPLASLLGLLCVGLFGSPLDVPRLSFLFYFVLITSDTCMAHYFWRIENAGLVNVRKKTDSDELLILSNDRHPPPLSTSGYPSNPDPGHLPRKHWSPNEKISFNSAGYRAVLFDTAAGLKIVGGMGIFITATWLLMHSPIVPYNVRNLLHPVHPFLSLIAMAIFLYWTLGFPVVVIRWLTDSPLKAICYPFFLIGHSLVAWLLITYSVSFDRIHKIVGSPVLGWHWYWEPAGRFVALFIALSLSMTVGTLIATRINYRCNIRLAFMVWLIFALALSPFLYWIIVINAATDNLIELMAGNGTTLAALLICTYLAAVTFEGSLLAGMIQRRLRGLKPTTLLIFLLSVPIACLAIYTGTQQHLEKYGKVFSALQFLMSPSRENYVPGSELVARYAIFHVAIVGLVTMIQYPFFTALYRDSDETNN